MGSVVDFAAGYYTFTMDDNVVPFTAFHVPGHGYYVYLRIPMGLTGAPYMFCEAVVTAMGEMLGRELENWMDDVAFASDSFEEYFDILKWFLDKCRTAKFSITLAKMKLFQLEFIFVGARLSEKGVSPNLDKVAAVIDFPRPKTIHDTMWFMGLTNWF